MKITLVTGNEHKLGEWRRLLGPDADVESVDIDLDEVQSLDLEAIVTDKAMRAYARVGRPVVVEDISAGIDSLNGLPGPFIKFFVKKLGKDCLIKLAGNESEPTTVTCMIAYYDGKKSILAKGEVRGVSTVPRGSNGFGFDFGFVPDGSDKTYAEMTPEEKDAVSHRSLAIKDFVSQLKIEVSISQ